ncbi:type IV pilus secretin PilQ [Pandoraea terrigena]|uniref:Type IV pilus biogenesis and competence protein PilQ n=1 Tax=Pandoraea terrigena TaxID=2508292 RepID=A0A5E4W4B4_9BURK|nr:type IV pilus secretin PilQ [Pandoraea terrigena]VVE18709.1 Type IV pilus biogenesis and competence protein PilQ [Pandoraea terrigena]
MYGERPPPDDVRDIFRDLTDRWRARWTAWTSVSPAEWSSPVRWGLAIVAWLVGFLTAWSVWWLVGLPVRATLLKDLGVEQQAWDRANDASHRLPALSMALRDAEADAMAWGRLLPLAAQNTADAAVDGGESAKGGERTPAPNPFESWLPESDDDARAAWRADLERLAARSGLTLEAARPGPSAPVGDLDIERAEIRVRGGVSDILGWLAEVNRLPRHLAVEHLSLEGPALGAPGAAAVGEADAGITAMVAAYAWRRPADLPSVPSERRLPALPAQVPRWQIPADTIDVFRTPLTRRSAQDAVTMTTSSVQPPVDDGVPVGSMRAGSRRVVFHRTSAAGLAANWSDGPPQRGHAAERPDALTVDVTLHGVEAADALRAFARLTGRSVVIGERVAGRLDMEVQRVSAAAAFEVMIRSAGLGIQSLNGVDWIAPRADLLADEQTQLEAAAKREALLPLASRRFTLNYPRALALREILMGEKDNKGRRLLSARGSLIADPRTNQLFVTDLPEKLDALALFIARIDVPVRQVLIEARIVEADDRFSESLGVRLAGYHARGKGGEKTGDPAVAENSRGIGGANRGGGTSSGSALDIGLPAAALAGVAPPSLAITLFGRSATRFLQLELSALETSGRGRVVSRPRVVTADKIQAVIEQGTELPYQTQSGRRGATSVQFRKATLRLEVTPLITPDGQVILDVDVRKDSVGQAVAQGFAVDTRHVKTQVQVEDGGTVAIGGIYQEERRDSRASVPWLGDVPLLGALFRNRAKEDRRTELLVFLTPSVVPEGRIGGDAEDRAASRGVSPESMQNDLPSGHRPLTGSSPG